MRSCLFICMQIRERKSELAKLEAIDSGKPLDETTWDIVCLRTYSVFSSYLSCTLSYILGNVVQDDVASCFEYFADHAEALDA